MKINQVINPAFERLTEIVDTIADTGIPEGAQLIYSGRNHVYTLNVGHGTVINIKEFKVPSVLNSLVYTNLRLSKARRSFENALRLNEMGINSPTPVAYIELKHGCRLRKSYYISVQVEAQDVRDWWEKPDAKPLTEALGKFMVKLHKMGVYHKDFSPGNILYVKSSDGRYHFGLIDLNRMRFNVLNHKTLMHNFSSISLIPEHTAELAKAYARAAGLDPEHTVAEALARLAAYKAKKRRLKRLKSIFKK